MLIFRGVSLKNQWLENDSFFQLLGILGVHVSFRGCSYDEML